MYVEGIGEFDLVPGLFIHVPKGIRHAVFDVTEELLLFDVFTLSIF